MENAGVGCGCFLWHIYNPFLRGRNLEATFYLGSPTVTHWKVTIKPKARQCISFWNFSFSLKFDESFDSPNEIVIDRLTILIQLNGKLITRTVERNYTFSENNDFTFSFEKHATVYPQMEPHLLDVRIEIFLFGKAIQNEMKYGLFAQDRDLRWLSEDLDVLLRNKKYSNMKLVSRSDNDPIGVHSYILYARWDNFFKLHTFVVGTQDTVRMRISRAVLVDIINYMYTGTVGPNWPDWKKVAYITEMFYVIEKYKLYHLYKVFAKTDLLQYRVTRNHVLISSCLFPIDIINNQLINDAPQMWYVNPGTTYEFIFRIKLRNDKREGPLVSYSLQSKSPFKLHVEVNLEVARREGGNNPQRVWHFHATNLVIDPHKTVIIKSVRFHGCPQAFGDFDTVSSDLIEIKYFIQCFFNVINGKTIMQVQSEQSDTIQDEKIRFEVLSDHLHDLRREQVDTDMVILNEAESPEYAVTYPVHKGIVATRSPDVGGNHYPNIIPNVLEIRLRRTVLPIILDYMYTGKLFTIPIEYLDEIEDFAEKTKFYSIKDYIKRIRSFYIEC